nr:hypothetical protein [Sphingobium sp. B2]
MTDFNFDCSALRDPSHFGRIEFRDEARVDHDVDILAFAGVEHHFLKTNKTAHAAACTVF